MNALRHGLCAKKHLLLPDDSRAQFAALEGALLDELAPRGALQTLLAHRLIAAAWRLQRADRLELELFSAHDAIEVGPGRALVRDGRDARVFPRSCAIAAPPRPSSSGRSRRWRPPAGKPSGMTMRTRPGPRRRRRSRAMWRRDWRENAPPCLYHWRKNAPVCPRIGTVSARTRRKTNPSGARVDRKATPKRQERTRRRRHAGLVGCARGPHAQRGVGGRQDRVRAAAPRSRETKRTRGARGRGPRRPSLGQSGAVPRPPFLTRRKCIDDGGSAGLPGDPPGLWRALPAQARAAG
jgi:hypothetical protein